VIRRSAFVAAGGFHPRLLIGGEEELIATDLAEAGWTMAYVSKSEIHHHASRLRNSHFVDAKESATCCGTRGSVGPC
jgi:N-acetylglucosaminyl-diphospho-decaprenol L-rhamnosyltransferase